MNFKIREICILDSDFIIRKISGKGHTIFLKDVDIAQYFFSKSSKHIGKVSYEGIESLFKIKSANLHIYGKEETRPNRKMGHVTIICDKFEEAYEKAKLIKQTIKVKSKTNG